MTEIETTNPGSTKVVPTSTTVLPKTLNFSSAKKWFGLAETGFSR